MHLSLIGMSGCGKTHWSQEFARKGFRLFCCDDLIADKLVSTLTRPDGTVAELGEWMGFPYQSNYEDREAKYLACEIEVLREILENLESSKGNSEEDVIVDTTGSVIYTEDGLLKRLQNATTVLHLATPPKVQEQMLKKYLKNRRPILWNGLFSKEPGESDDEALARCYPALLAAREQMYAQYADVTIDYYQRNHNGFKIEDLLSMVKG